MSDFLGTIPTFFKNFQKVKLPDVEFNTESIGTNFKSQKWKTKNLVCSFVIAFFHFETNLIKERFFFCSGPFWTVGNFFPSRSEAEKLACSDKKKNLCSNLVPKVSSFYIRTKSILRNRVTAVHYNVKQISSFAYAFEGEIYAN